MKQTKIICDRCGKVITEFDKIAMVCSGVDKDSLVYLITEFTTDTNVDLCAACHKELVEWLGGKKNESV